MTTLPIRHLVLASACLLLSVCVAAQTASTDNTVRLADGAASPAARVADLAFLAGSWRGPGVDGGDSEEIWAEPAAGQMMGVFRQFRDGKPRFYEFMLMSEVGDTVELRIKHFNPDVTGWEEKDKYTTFKLVKVEGQNAWFSGLTFKRQGNSLKIYLALRRGGPGSGPGSGLMSGSEGEERP